MRGRGRAFFVAAALLAVAPAAVAATLPEHAGLRILIVSDEVNPHGLPAGQLTQPGELSAAFLDPASGLIFDPAPDSLVEIPTNAIEQATARLAAAPGTPSGYDLLVYFAHRIPDNGNDDVARQAAFTAAVEAFLARGGGVLSFHHGSYWTPGKEAMLGLIGATASGAVTWNTVEGQNVINVAPDHFVTCYGVDYPMTIGYADPGRNVPAADWPAFNNTPDERYLTFDINPTAGAIELLFGSDFVQNGSAHLLGFTHRRPEWSGVVVGYQPGEYQPNALDPGGRNFQILANALIWAARRVPADGVLLRAARGPGAGEVSLAWEACEAESSIYRSTDPANVTDPGNLLAATSGFSWIDSPPPGIAYFYRVIH